MDVVNPVRSVVWLLLLIAVAILDVLLALGIVALFSPEVLPDYNIAFSNAYGETLGALDLVFPSIVLFFVVFSCWVWGTFLVVAHYFLRAWKRVIPQSIEARSIGSCSEAVVALPKYWYILLILAGVLVTILIYWYRFTILFVPQGFDTPGYLYAIQVMRQDLLYGLVHATVARPLFFLILYFLSFGFAGSLNLLFILLPVCLAVLYCFAVFFFAKSVTSDSLLAVLSLNLSAASFFLVRMSYDLYSNLLYMSIMVVFLGLTIKAMRTRRRGLIFSAIMLTFVAVSVHAWSFLVTLLTLAFFSVMMLIEKRKAFLKDLSVLIMILAPSSIIVVVALLINPRILPLSAIKWFSLPKEWYWLAAEESNILLLFAVLGLLVSLFKKDDYHRMLSAWTFTIPLSILLVGYQEPYRFYILLPLGLLAAQGVYSIFRTVCGVMRGMVGDQRSKCMGGLIILALILPVGYSTLRLAYIPQYAYYPDYVTMGQLHFIENSFGFSNHSIVVLVYGPRAQPLESRSDPNLNNWIKATVGKIAYFGHLLTLLSGNPDAYGAVIDCHNKTVILADQLYMVTAFEQAITEPLGHSGVYALRTTNSTEITNILLAKSNWSDTSFQGTWRLIDGSLPTDVYNNGSNLKLRFYSYPSSGWFTIEYYYDPPYNLSNAGTLILRVAGEITTIRMIVEAYSGDYAFAGLQSTHVGQNWSWIVIPLPNDHTLDRLRIAFEKLEVGSGFEFAEFDYIALI